MRRGLFVADFILGQLLPARCCWRRDGMAPCVISPMHGAYEHYTLARFFLCRDAHDDRQIARAADGLLRISGWSTLQSIQPKVAQTWCGRNQKGGFLVGVSFALLLEINCGRICLMLYLEVDVRPFPTELGG